MITGFGNYVVSSLATDITASQTTLPVMPGTGAIFAHLLTQDFENTSNPLPSFAKLTLTDVGETVFEICHLISVSGDTLTVIRGQEGTTAKGWLLNDAVSNFATRGSENLFVQLSQLQSGHYTAGVAGGTANALTLELPAAFFINGTTEWMLRAPVVLYPTLNNTGAATLQLTMGERVLGTFPLRTSSGGELAARDNLGLGTAATHDAEDFMPSSYTPPAAPVTSVNNETGDVQLSAGDVNAPNKEACSYVGFASNNVNNPYLRHEPTDTVVYLMRADAAAASYVSRIQFGAEGWAGNDDNVLAPAGCVVTGTGDFGADNGSIFYRPMQYVINGVPYTAAYTSMLLNLPTDTVDINVMPPINHITELVNCQPYRNLFFLGVEGENDKGVLSLRGEGGLDFYVARNLLTGSVFISYENDTGIIRQIDTSPLNMWPIGMSIRGLDSLPDGCDIDGGTWVYDAKNGIVSQVPELVGMKNKRGPYHKRLRAAIDAYTLFQIAPPADYTQKDAALKNYIADLQDVDLTQPDPDWPPAPEFIN